MWISLENLQKQISRYSMEVNLLKMFPIFNRRPFEGLLFFQRIFYGIRPFHRLWIKSFKRPSMKEDIEHSKFLRRRVPFQRLSMEKMLLKTSIEEDPSLESSLLQRGSLKFVYEKKSGNQSMKPFKNPQQIQITAWHEDDFQISHR